MAQLLRAMSRHRRWEQISQQAGVSLDRTSAIILQVLAAPTTKHCKLHEVAERLGIEAPAVTRKAQLLEKAGLLTKTIDPTDARAYTLNLTSTGIEIARRLKQAKRTSLKTNLAGWSEHDRQRLAHYIQRFADSITESNEQQKAITRN